MRALVASPAAAGIAEGPVFHHLAAEKTLPGVPAPQPCIGSRAITPCAVAAIIKARAAEAGFDPRDFGGHSLKRGALTTGMDLGEHPARLKRLGRHKSFDVLGEYLEFGDLFESHPLGKVL